jgi:hypothetical protein
MILKEDYERQEAAEIRHCRADLRIRPERRDLAKAPYLIGYARVSKGDAQSNVAQRRALDAAGCKRVLGSGHRTGTDIR